MMISLKEPILSFGGIDAVIDRLEIVSFAYNRDPGRDPHLDIGVRVGQFVAEVQETIEAEHGGFQMNEVEQHSDSEASSPLVYTRTCHECKCVEQWDDVKSQWSGDHDMEACLAAKPSETRVVSEAHIEWLGGTSIVLKGAELEGLGIGRLESAVGGWIQKLTQQGEQE